MPARSLHNPHTAGGPCCSGPDARSMCAPCPASASATPPRWRTQEVLRLLQRRGIAVRVATRHLAAEEAPESYKVGAGYGCCGVLPAAAAAAAAAEESCWVSTNPLLLGCLPHPPAHPAHPHCGPRGLTLAGRGRCGGHLPCGRHLPQGRAPAPHRRRQGLSAGSGSVPRQLTQCRIAQQPRMAAAAAVARRRVYALPCACVCSCTAPQTVAPCKVTCLQRTSKLPRLAAQCCPLPAGGRPCQRCPAWASLQGIQARDAQVAAAINCSPAAALKPHATAVECVVCSQTHQGSTIIASRAVQGEAGGGGAACHFYAPACMRPT